MRFSFEKNLSKSRQAMFFWKRKSLRRNQFPLANFIAITIHKLMRDAFTLLATSISSILPENGLWLISQLYVLVGRVKQLNQLFFIGNKDDALNAID